MKSYKNLMEQLLSIETIDQAIENIRSEKHHMDVVHLKAKHILDEWGARSKVRGILMDYRRKEHKVVTIHDGVSKKQREIIVPTFKDLVVQHCIMVVLRPIIMKSMYEKVYGSIPGRGAHAGKRAIERWIRTDPGGVKYYAKMDIKKCFPSVPSKRLWRYIRLILKDDAFVDLLKECSQDPVIPGLPLGFYTSPWLLNLYLTPFDHYVKEVLHVRHYIRYMDDIVIFGSNKEDLEDAVHCMIACLDEFFGLTIKPDYELKRFSYKMPATNDRERRNMKLRKDGGYPLDFMGFLFYRTRTTIRKKLLYKITRKAGRVGRKSNISVHDAESIISYMGWINHTDSYNVYRNYILPRINPALCRQIVSRHNKQANERIVVDASWAVQKFFDDEAA